MPRPLLAHSARRVTATVITAALLAVVVHLDASARTDAAQATARNFPVSTVNADVREVAEILRRAQDVELVACMAEQGFTFMPFTAAQREAHLGSMGEHGEGFAGAHPAADEFVVDTETSTPREPHAPGWKQYWSGLSESEQLDWRTAFEGRGDHEAVQFTLSDGTVLGVATGGCLGRAKRAVLGGDFAEAERVDVELQLLSIRAVEAARRDDAYTSALSQWQACVARAGHRAASPEALREDVVGSVLNARATASPALARVADLERAAAADADAACRRTTDLDEVQRATQQVAEQSVVREEQALLADWSDLRARILDAATSRIDVPSNLVNR